MCTVCRHQPSAIVTNPIPTLHCPRIGVGLNNNKLCGCVLVGLLSTREDYLSKLPAALKTVSVDQAALGSMFRSLDIIGISAYISLKPDFNVCEIERVRVVGCILLQFWWFRQGL